MISGIEQQQLLDEIKAALIKAVDSHETWTDFNKEVDGLFESYGVTDLHPGHFQTVFRTNLASAYSQGQFSQVLAMPDRFPMWQYSAIHDYRTRPSHMALDGNVYNVGEGPLPPIDYNCRCSAIYLHVYDTQTRSLAPQLYTGDPIVRFNNYRDSADWLISKYSTLSPDLHNWIESHLK
ncbi:MAG: phage head morphogenesis protein [Bacteroidetes bacterium]|nr:phage head morphogenesis protein [Bacteroidota bacterium]